MHSCQFDVRQGIINQLVTTVCGTVWGPRAHARGADWGISSIPWFSSESNIADCDFAPPEGHAIGHLGQLSVHEHRLDEWPSFGCLCLPLETSWGRSMLCSDSQYQCEGVWLCEVFRSTLQLQISCTNRTCGMQGECEAVFLQSILINKSGALPFKQLLSNNVHVKLLISCCQGRSNYGKVLDSH